MCSSISGSQQGKKPFSQVVDIAVKKPADALGRSVIKTDGFKKLTTLISNTLTLIKDAFNVAYKPLANVITHLKSWASVMAPFELIDRFGDWFVPEEKSGKLMVQTASTQKVVGRLFLTGVNVIDTIKFCDFIGLITLGKIAAQTAIKSIIFTPLELIKSAFVLGLSSAGIAESVSKMKDVDVKKRDAGAHITKWSDRSKQNRDDLLKVYKEKRLSLVDASGAPIKEKDSSRAKKYALYVASLSGNAGQCKSATEALIKFYQDEYVALHNGHGKLIDPKSAELASKYSYYAKTFRGGVEQGIQAKSTQKAARWKDIHSARLENGKKEKTKSWISIAADIIRIVATVAALGFTFGGLMTGGVAAVAITTAVLGFVSAVAGYVKFLNEEYTKLKPEASKLIVPKGYTAPAVVIPL